MGIHFLSDAINSPLTYEINFYVFFFSYGANCEEYPIGYFALLKLKLF